MHIKRVTEGPGKNEYPLLFVNSILYDIQTEGKGGDKYSLTTQKLHFEIISIEK